MPNARILQKRASQGFRDNKNEPDFEWSTPRRKSDFCQIRCICGATFYFDARPHLVQCKECRRERRYAATAEAPVTEET